MWTISFYTFDKRRFRYSTPPPLSHTLKDCAFFAAIRRPHYTFQQLDRKCSRNWWLAGILVRWSQWYQNLLTRFPLFIDGLLSTINWACSRHGYGRSSENAFFWSWRSVHQGAVLKWWRKWFMNQLFLSFKILFKSTRTETFSRPWIRIHVSLLLLLLGVQVDWEDKS